MIKLRDIIRLKEGIDNPLTNDPEENKASIEEIIRSAREMGVSNPLIYRGMNSGYLISRVDNDRVGFRGGNLGAKTILSELGVKYPLFAYNNAKVVDFFGAPKIIVLKKPYTIYQSPEVEDIMMYAKKEIYKDEEAKGGGILRTQIGNRSEEEIVERAKQGARTYKELDGSTYIDSREIIIDAKEYWAIGRSIQDKGGSYMPKKPFETYSELIVGLEAYKRFLIYRMTNK
jgi:hypothetical protein